jgi:hypothetical protein
MNHLFNAVPTVDGTLIYVEPQGNNGNWPMNIFWGSAYDRAYNVDETDYWTEQIKEYK